MASRSLQQFPTSPTVVPQVAPQERLSRCLTQVSVYALQGPQVVTQARSHIETTPMQTSLAICDPLAVRL